MTIASRESIPVVVPIDSPESERVLKTIEHADLDPEQTCVVGSAALALYGVILPQDPSAHEARPRPSDVDYVSTGSYAINLADHAQDHDLSFGGSSHNFQNLIVNFSNEDDRLPIDLIVANPGTFRRQKTVDRRLREYIHARTAIIDGTSTRIISLAQAEGELKRRVGSGSISLDPKAQSDLASLRRYISQTH